MYDDVHAVKDVNLQIRDKEFMVFVGPSGCGKTTTLRMVAGLEAITSGDISIDGTVVNDLPPMDRDIAMVFQNYALYPHMSVYDNMAFGLKMRKFDQARDRQARQGRGRDPRHRATPQAQAAPALGRPAPARRARPRHRAPPAGVPVRRAAVQPRRQAARADARRAQEAAPAPRHDGRLRHPRSGRGHDARRPRRRHEGRLGAAGGRAARALQSAGQPVRRRLHRLAGDELRHGDDDRRQRPPDRQERRHGDRGAERTTPSACAPHVGQTDDARHPARGPARGDRRRSGRA